MCSSIGNSGFSRDIYSVSVTSIVLIFKIFKLFERSFIVSSMSCVFVICSTSMSFVSKFSCAFVLLSMFGSTIVSWSFSLET